MCENNLQIINAALNTNDYKEHFFLKLNFNFMQEFAVETHKQTTLFSTSILHYTDILTS